MLNASTVYDAVQAIPGGNDFSDATLLKVVRFSLVPVTVIACIVASEYNKTGCELPTCCAGRASLQENARAIFLKTGHQHETLMFLLLRTRKSRISPSPASSTARYHFFCRTIV